MRTNWLPGWTAIELSVSEKSPASLSASCRRKCEALIEVGQKLFGLGVLPELKGVESAKISQSHRDGTGGNLAIRHRPGFVVTGAGTHKGRLEISSDFAVVDRVLWEAREVYFYRLGNRQPSTDSLLVAMAFEMDAAISSWIHVHCAVDTPHSLKLNYPAIQKTDWNSLRAMVESGARVINLVDHDVSKPADQKPDSVIILGEGIEEAVKLALSLIIQPKKFDNPAHQASPADSSRPAAAKADDEESRAC